MTDEIHGNNPDGLNFEQWLKFQINLVFEKGPKFKINWKFARGAPNQENRRASDTGVVGEKLRVSRMQGKIGVSRGNARQVGKRGTQRQAELARAAPNQQNRKSQRHKCGGKKNLGFPEAMQGKFAREMPNQQRWTFTYNNIINDQYKKKLVLPIFVHWWWKMVCGVELHQQKHKKYMSCLNSRWCNFQLQTQNGTRV